MHRRTPCYSQTGTVGVTACAQPPARLGVDFRAVGHGQADLALGDVALRCNATLPVSLDVLLANRLLLQQVADLHDVADDLHGACQGFLTGGEIFLHLFQVGSRGPAFCS